MPKLQRISSNLIAKKLEVFPETEFSFKIPSGSFVNIYDLQGITDNSQESTEN